MRRQVFCASLAATLAASAAQSAEPPMGAAIVGDGAFLAQALAGPAIDLTRRGTMVTVTAQGRASEDGCAALLSVRGPDGDRRWQRELRWDDVAWSGSGADGRFRIAFYDHAAGMAVDMLALRPADPAAFAAAVERVSLACRMAHAPDTRVVADRPAETACYFSRLPGLQVFQRPASALGPGGSEAVLSILSRESAEGVLRIAFAKGSSAKDGLEAWHNPEIDFGFVHPRMADLGLVETRITLDGKPVAAQQSLAVYGHTRVLVGIDSFKAPVAKQRPDSFYRRLAASSRAAVELVGANQTILATLTFDTAPALAAARVALASTDWSCTGALAAPAPVASWRPDEDEAVATS